MSLVDILATASLSDARASCAHDAICVVTERLLGLLQQPMLSTSLTVVAQQAAQQEPPPPTAPHANGDDDGHCHRGHVAQQPPNARARLLRAVTRLYLRLVQAGGADDEVVSDDGDGRGGSSNNRSGAVIAAFMRCDDVVNAVLFDGPFCLSIEEYWETQQQLRDEATSTRDGVAVPEKRDGDCMARSLERMLRCLGPAAARRVVLASSASSPRRSLWCRHLWETLRCAAPIVEPRPVAATSSVVTGAVAQEHRAVRRTYASLWAPLVLCQLLLADARAVVTVDQLLSHSAPQSSDTEEDMGADCAHHARREHFWTRLAAPFSGALRCWCKTPTTSVHASPIAAPLYVPVDIGPLAPNYVSTPDDVDALQEALLDATIASLAEVPCAPRCCGGDRGGVVADEDVLQGTQATAEALLCMFYNDTDSMEGQVVQYALQRPDALILERPGVFDRFDADHQPNSRHPRLPGGPMPSLPLPASAALSTDVAQIGMLLAAFPDRLWGEEVGSLLEAGGGTSPAAPMPEGDVAAVAASVIASTGWRAFAVVHSADAVAFPSTQQFRSGGGVAAPSVMPSSSATTARRVLTLRKPIAAAAIDRSEMTTDPPPCTAMGVIMSESFVCAAVRCVAALGAEQASLSGALRRLHHAAANGGGLAADGLIFQSPGGTTTAGATTAATSQKRMSIVAAPPSFLAAMLGRMPHRSAPRAAAYADMRDNAHESTRGHAPMVDAKDDALPPPPPVGSHFCAVVLSLAVLRYAVQLCAAVGVWCPESQGLITAAQRRVNKLKGGCQDSSSSNGTQPPTTQLAAVAPMCIACLTKTMQFCPGWFLCEFGLDGLVPMLRAMMDALWLEAQAAPDDGAVTVDGTARSLVMHILGDMIQWLTAAPHQ